MDHGHVCPRCEGLGTLRVKGKSGSVRIPCSRCDGTGQLRPER